MKNNLLIVIIILAGVLFVIFNKKIFKNMTKILSYNKVPLYNVTESKLVDAFKKLKRDFNMTPEESKKLEQLARKETRHFESGQFLRSLSPGMEAFKDSHPFGWVSLNKYFWSKKPKYAPSSLYSMPENVTGKSKRFLRFKNLESGLAAVLMNARMKGGMFEKWRSNDPSVFCL